MRLSRNRFKMPFCLSITPFFVGGGQGQDFFFKKMSFSGAATVDYVIKSDVLNGRFEYLY